MDVAEFNDWLSGIAALTPPQRRQAWQTLALAEISDCDDSEIGPLWGVDICQQRSGVAAGSTARLHAIAGGAAVGPAWNECRR